LTGADPGPNPVPDMSPAPPPGPRGATWNRRVLEFLAVIVVALLATLAVRAYLFEAFFIPSVSMTPTLQVGDRVLVDRLSYHLHPVHRGDIIVFSPPPAENCGGSRPAHLIKRVIGLPGDRISSAGNTVLIDGRPLAEPWLHSPDPLGTPIKPYTVPAGQYYVLGDHRNDSCDSRFWGPVPRSLIVGEAIWDVWPPSRIGSL
jgi:signal peptidase I